MKDYIEKSKLNKPTKLYLILAVTFFLIGIGIIVGISVNESLKSVSTKNYVVTTGVVVDYKVYETNYNNGSTHKVYMYAEIAEFDIGGKKYRVTNSVGSTHPYKNIGDSIKIAYNPENPLDCVFISSGNITFTVLLALFGVLFAGVGVVLLIYYVQKCREWNKSK